MITGTPGNVSCYFLIGQRDIFFFFLRFLVIVMDIGMATAWRRGRKQGMSFQLHRLTADSVQSTRWLQVAIVERVTGPEGGKRAGQVPRKR